MVLRLLKRHSEYTNGLLESHRELVAAVAAHRSDCIEARRKLFESTSLVLSVLDEIVLGEVRPISQALKDATDARAAEMDDA